MPRSFLVTPEIFRLQEHVRTAGHARSTADLEGVMEAGVVVDTQNQMHTADSAQVPVHGGRFHSSFSCKFSLKKSLRNLINGIIRLEMADCHGHTHLRAVTMFAAVALSPKVRC